MMASPSTLPPALSALQTFIQSRTPSAEDLLHEPHYHHLALQVLHNLQYQHDWTSLTIHTHSPLTSAQPALLPRPLVSGLPPRRIYVHPDEQIEMLKAHIKEEDAPVEREWVLPTHLREKWSLRRFADVFDAVTEIPPKCSSDEQDEGKKESKDEESKKRRGGKRVLLATVSDDSTVVYYIVHDGIVKPRQN